MPHDQIRDSSMVEAIVDLRDTRCVRISDSLIVDVLLCLGVVLERWVSPFDELGFRYYTTARPGVRVRHADALGTSPND